MNVIKWQSHVGVEGAMAPQIKKKKKKKNHLYIWDLEISKSMKQISQYPPPPPHLAIKIIFLSKFSLKIKIKWYVHNIFHNKSKWWVIIISNLKPPLILFFTHHLNLKWQIYCKNIVNITLQKHKYSYYQDIYTIKARIYFYHYLIK